MDIRGICHCGNLDFWLAWPTETNLIPARECTCTFCRRHGACWTAHPEGSLRVDIRDLRKVSRYAFGTRTAEFHICSSCGVVPLATSRIDGRVYAVVNVNTFVEPPELEFERAPVSFDRESERARLERRQRVWLADVRFASDGANMD